MRGCNSAASQPRQPGSRRAQSSSASWPVAVTWPNSDSLQQAGPLQRCRTPLPRPTGKINETISDLRFYVAGVGFEPT
jgi:hypothetical protein